MQEGVPPLHCCVIAENSVEVATLLLEKYKVDPATAEHVVSNLCQYLELSYCWSLICAVKL